MGEGCWEYRDLGSCITVCLRDDKVLQNYRMVAVT